MYKLKETSDKPFMNILLYAIYRNSGCIQFIYNEMNSKIFINSAPLLQTYTHNSRNNLLYDWSKKGIFALDIHEVALISKIFDWVLFNKHLFYKKRDIFREFFPVVFEHFPHSKTSDNIKKKTSLYIDLSNKPPAILTLKSVFNDYSLVVGLLESDISSLSMAFNSVFYNLLYNKTKKVYNKNKSYVKKEFTKNIEVESDFSNEKETGNDFQIKGDFDEDF